MDAFRPNRRWFLGAAAGSTAAGAMPLSVTADEAPAATAGPRAILPRRANRPRRKLALVTTVYRYLSHSYHIARRFMEGYLKDGRPFHPDWDIASMYVDQPRTPDDLSREHARDFGVTIHDSIAGALTLGTDRLAVDGVLLIAEHGDYPLNDRGQKLYPRFEMFNQIVDVFRRSNRVVPVFNDKHLSFDRRKAKEMVEVSRKMQIPLFAGSSLPVTWRKPELELPIGVRLREALVAGFSDLDTYGFHVLESLQCMVERRTQGQQGVAAVRCIVGDEVWKAGDAGLWSWELLEHALGRSPSRNTGDIRRNCRNFPTQARNGTPTNPVAFLVEYRDGFKATAMLLSGHVTDITFACKIEGERRPSSTLFDLPPPPGAAFLEALSRHVEQFLEGRPAYPVERTLLTSMTLDALLESRVRGQRRLEIPDIDIRYDPPRDSGFMRGDYVSPVSM
ncbi:MAG: hypothetical protein U0744_05205 [Gemmataceae bacterium]